MIQDNQLFVNIESIHPTDIWNHRVFYSQEEANEDREKSVFCNTLKTVTLEEAIKEIYHSSIPEDPADFVELPQTPSN